MKQSTQVCLFGSLRKGPGDLDKSPLQLDMEAPTPLAEVLERLKISLDMVQVAMVNFKAVPKDSTIHPGDRLSLFPKEYPVFADWRDLRF
jgi:sulfur carrier protein ThiS